SGAFRKRLNHLLRCPGGGWMLRNVEMNDLTPLVQEDDKAVKITKGRSGNGKEINADDVPVWLQRKVFHVWDEGLADLIRYLATVDSVPSSQRRWSSAGMRGTPNRGFSRDIFPINSRISWSIFGRPTGAFDFHRQYKRKLCLCHLMTVSGLMMIKPSRQFF